MRYIKVTNNMAWLILRKLSDYEEKGHMGGDFRVEIHGVVWCNTCTFGEWDTFCRFVGMKSGSWDYQKPDSWYKKYEEEDQDRPDGIWSYEQEFGGDARFGQFVSMGRIHGMAASIVVEKIDRGEFEESEDKWTSSF